MECDAPIRTCQATDRVHDAKAQILEESGRARLREQRRASAEQNLTATAAARQARLADARQENRRLGCVAAWEHLRALGLGSPVVDAVLKDLAES